MIINKCSWYDALHFIIHRFTKESINEIGRILTIPTYATITVPEINVPDEILKMKLEDAYKKAYEEAF